MCDRKAQLPSSIVASRVHMLICTEDDITGQAHFFQEEAGAETNILICTVLLENIGITLALLLPKAVA